jgi:hypothetical protein
MQLPDGYYNRHRKPVGSRRAVTVCTAPVACGALSTKCEEMPLGCILDAHARTPVGCDDSACRMQALSDLCKLRLHTGGQSRLPLHFI